MPEPRGAAVVRLIGLTWVVVACLIVGAMLIVTPTSVANVVAAFLILGGPGLLLVPLARDLRAHNRLWRWGWVALLLLPFSIVLFAGYGCFVLLRTIGPPPDRPAVPG